MLCYIFIIAVILPALSRGESTKKASSCFSNPNVTVATDKFEKQFNETLESGWKPDTGNKFKTAYNDFIAVSAKECNQSTEDHNGNDYLNFVKHVFTSDYLADFLNDSASSSIKCVSSAHSEIDKCLKKHVVDDREYNTTEYNAKLWKYSQLKWNANSCNITLKIRQCTMEVISKYEECKPIKNFVADLFDGVRKCEGIEESNVINDSLRQDEGKSQKGSSNTIVVMVLIIIIVEAMYVVVRDWRFKKLPWSRRGRYGNPESASLDAIGSRFRPAA